MLSLAAPALPGCRLFVSADVDETRERISAVMQPHVLRPAGRRGASNAYMDFLRLPELGIGAIHLGHMSVRVDAIIGYHLVVFCRGGAGRLQTSVGDVVVSGARGAYLAPGEPLIGEFSDDCEQLVFRIDERLLQRMAGEGQARLPPTIRSDSVELKPWLSTLSMLLGDFHYVSLLKSNPVAAGAYQQLCLAMLLAGIAGSGRSRGARDLMPAGVLRAKAYIRDAYAKPIALIDIADAAQLPVRTLLHHFKSFLGSSPIQYLRDCRLDAAREKLLDSRSENSTVAAVALDVGLTHLGRFSVAYFHRFGEHPSDTLASRTARISGPYRSSARSHR